MVFATNALKTSSATMVDATNAPSVLNTSTRENVTDASKASTSMTDHATTVLKESSGTITSATNAEENNITMMESAILAPNNTFIGKDPATSAATRATFMIMRAILAKLLSSFTKETVSKNVPKKPSILTRQTENAIFALKAGSKQLSSIESLERMLKSAIDALPSSNGVQRKRAAFVLRASSLTEHATCVPNST